MRLTLCGTRGSTPVSGLTQGRYGGRTSAVALAHDGQRPSLVLDAGTGLVAVTDLMDGHPFRGALLLSHLHWDHTHGMPFFAAGLQDGHRVDVVMPEQGLDPERVLERAFSPPHFPIMPRQLGPGWTFRGVEAADIELEGFAVRARDIPHKGGRTLGFRASDATASIAYLPDHSPLGLGPGDDGLGALHPAALELAHGVDLLIHDAQHTATELPAMAYLGHSAAEYAVGLAQAAGAREVMLFHHAPTRTDDQIDEIVAQLSVDGREVRAAADGAVVELPRLVGKPGKQ